MGVLLRELGFLVIVAVSLWAGYEVFSIGFWLDYTMATVAGALSSIVALVVILATIDYCLMTSWSKPSVDYEAYDLTKKIKNYIDGLMSR